MTPPRVLILNGSHAEIPLIQAAKKLGHEVITTGADPEGLGHPYADRYVHADYSDPNAVTELAREEEVVGIVASCNDFAAMSAAVACHELGLPGHDAPEVARRLHHKDKFRTLTTELGIPGIRAMTCTTDQDAYDALEALGSPVIVKPVDLTGGKGITVCRTRAEVRSAVQEIRRRSREDHFLVEEFIAGSHHGFTCFIADQQVVWWFADDEQYYLNPYLVNGTSTPTSMPETALQELRVAVNAIAKHLNLVDGLVHLQCVLGEQGPRIIEVCRRCPGDLYPEFVRHATEWDYAGAVVTSELGQGRTDFPTSPSLIPIVRHCAMPDREGTYMRTEIIPALGASVLARWPLLETGARITDHLTQKTDIAFIGFPSSDEVHQYLTERDSNLRVVIEQEGS